MADRQLPHPWQWLSDAEPEPGQQCEWVLLAPWGGSQGAGPWKVIGNGVDWPRFCVPGAVIKGFEDDKGLMVSDPSFTAWMPSNKPKPRNLLYWDTARNWKRVPSSIARDLKGSLHPELQAEGPTSCSGGDFDG